MLVLVSCCDVVNSVVMFCLSVLVLFQLSLLLLLLLLCFYCGEVLLSLVDCLVNRVVWGAL